MALTATDKNLLIATMERYVQDGVEAAGVASLAALESSVAGLRTAYTTSPATVTAAQINDIATKLKALKFPTLVTISDVFTEATTEAAAG